MDGIHSSPTIKDPVASTGVINCLRIMLLGDGYVGKSSLMSQYMHGRHSFIHGNKNLVTDFLVKLAIVGGKQVKLMMWDCVGSLKFQCVARTMLPNKEGFVLCYDVTDRKSLEAVKTWHDELEMVFPGGIPMILVANKCDDPYHEVSIEEGQSLADEWRIPFFPVSAITGSNVQESFYWLLNKAMEVKEENEFLASRGYIIVDNDYL